MTNIRTLFLALGLLPLAASAQTYLECDFNEGIPADFTLIDGDQLSPSTDMQNLGFAVGIPWIALTPKGGDSMAACSTSWYKPAGQSDDWMITPAHYIADDGANVTWCAQASDKKYRDGYAVYVACVATDSQQEPLQWHPLLTVDQEKPVWTRHTVPLDAYKDQTVCLAFVNNSKDKSRLYIDDLFVGVRSSVMLRLSAPQRIPTMGQVAITGTAYTYDEAPVEGFTIGLTVVRGADSVTTTQHFNDTLQLGQPLSFILDEQIDLPFHETVPYTVWIEHGTDRYTVSTDMTSYPRHVVCEEGTGTWCGWCVRGLVMLDSLKRNCGDWTIGIAAHSGDPMANAYIGGVVRYMQGGGFPDGTVNRLYKSDPGNFFVAAQYAFTKEPVLVAMQAQARLDVNTRQVQADTHLWFADASDTANYRLGYTVIENNVHQPDDDGYRQHNSYAGGKSGAMGGYENQPDYVPADQMWYQEVARGYVDDIMGVEGSVPASFAADEELLFSKTFPLPDGILDDRNTELVVMLIDQTDGRIVNAVCVPLNQNEVNSIADASLVAVDQVVYDLYGRPLTSSKASHKGFRLVRQSDGAVRKILSVAR